MNGLVTADAPNGGSGALTPLAGEAGTLGDRIRAFTSQPSVRKVLPLFVGTAGLGLLALTWATLSPAPQRVLYDSLGDAERAGVVASLEQAGIAYQINNMTGQLTVGEDEYHLARSRVVSDGSLATPTGGAELIENLPMGASRTLEGDRLRAAQERELMLTIEEIDGVQSVRVHIAKAERSVFVREDVAPSASVMVRMARGRQLGDDQVRAIVSLVAASVPGLGPESVKVVDQHGNLLTEPREDDDGLLDLQARMEAKLNAQVDQLLTPMFGRDAFSSQVQVELDMSEVTSARESYDQDGRVRRESTQQSQSVSSQAGGIPGVLSNTPPADPEAEFRAPEETRTADAANGIGESSATRIYELGREVQVSSLGPGSVTYLSVAVAIDEAILAEASEADIAKVKDLVSAAVGAREDRGDQVMVMTRSFERAEEEAVVIPFWETSWFSMAVRHGVALLGVILVLFLAVRPAIKAARGDDGSKRTRSDDADDEQAELLGDDGNTPALAAPGSPAGVVVDAQALDGQIQLAQRIARENPDDAVLALRRLLAEDTRSGASA